MPPRPVWMVSRCDEGDLRVLDGIIVVDGGEIAPAPARMMLPAPPLPILCVYGVEDVEDLDMVRGVGLVI